MLNQKLKKVIAGVTCIVTTACTVMAGSQKAAGQIDGRAAALISDRESECIPIVYFLCQIPVKSLPEKGKELSLAPECPILRRIMILQS